LGTFCGGTGCVAVASLIRILAAGGLAITSLLAEVVLALGIDICFLLVHDESPFEKPTGDKREMFRGEVAGGVKSG